MIRVNHQAGSATESDLEQVIQPLANYICASDQPRAALKLVLAVLINEVQLTNRAALAHVARRRFTSAS